MNNRVEELLEQLERENIVNDNFSYADDSRYDDRYNDRYDDRYDDRYHDRIDDDYDDRYDDDSR